MRAIEPLGFEVCLSTRFAVAEYELKRLVAEKGVSYVWRLVPLREAVLPPGPVQRPGLLKLLDAMLAKLAPTFGFVIVDPYLLPKKTPASYLPELLSLIEPICRTVATILLITLSDYDATLLQNLQASLAGSCPSCQLIHRGSNRYHDRFWIADETRELFIGTSLNGIGRRYALADFMDDADVAQAVADLKGNGLL